MFLGKRISFQGNGWPLVAKRMLLFADVADGEAVSGSAGMLLPVWQETEGRAKAAIEAISKAKKPIPANIDTAQRRLHTNCWHRCVDDGSYTAFLFKIFSPVH